MDIWLARTVILHHARTYLSFKLPSRVNGFFFNIFTGAFHIRLTITGQNNVGEQKDFNNKGFAVKQDKTQAKINLFQA